MHTLSHPTFFGWPGAAGPPCTQRSAPAAPRPHVKQNDSNSSPAAIALQARCARAAVLSRAPAVSPHFPRFNSYSFWAAGKQQACGSVGSLPLAAPPGGGEYVHGVHACFGAPPPFLLLAAAGRFAPQRRAAARSHLATAPLPVRTLHCCARCPAGSPGGPGPLHLSRQVSPLGPFLASRDCAGWLPWSALFSSTATTLCAGHDTTPACNDKKN